MAQERSEQIAAFYAAHARGLERAVARQAADRESANDACARAWELLLERPQIDLDHRGLKWLQTTAVREAWRQHSRHTAGLERLDQDLDNGETAGERLVGSEDRVEQRLEAERRLALLNELSPDQRRTLLLQAAGLSYEEITQTTGARDRKIRRDITRGRAKLTVLARENRSAREPDPAALLHAARARRSELILARAETPAEQLEQADRRLANVTATVRALSAEVVERQLADPPRWATALLGPRPADRAQAAAYDTGLREAARYRVTHGVRDGEPRLGPVPMQRQARADYQRASTAITAAKSALGQHPQPPPTDIGRGASTARPAAGQLSIDYPRPQRGSGTER